MKISEYLKTHNHIYGKAWLSKQQKGILKQLEASPKTSRELVGDRSRIHTLTRLKNRGLITRTEFSGRKPCIWSLVKLD